MKKLIMLSVVGIITLSSFGVKNYNVKKAEVELQTWYYRCADGTTGTFFDAKRFDTYASLGSCKCSRSL